MIDLQKKIKMFVVGSYIGIPLFLFLDTVFIVLSF